MYTAIPKIFNTTQSKKTTQILPDMIQSIKGFSLFSQTGKRKDTWNHENLCGGSQNCKEMVLKEKKNL